MAFTLEQEMALDWLDEHLDWGSLDHEIILGTLSSIYFGRLPCVRQRIAARNRLFQMRDTIVPEAIRPTQVLETIIEDAVARARLGIEGTQGSPGSRDA